MKFNDLIKTKRKEMDFTQEKLANLIGTSKQTIANWENGRNNPLIGDEVILNSIAKVFKINKVEVMESIIGSEKIQENDNIIIKYQFLPNELINLKLTKEEIEILFGIEYFKNYNNIIFKEDYDKTKFIINELHYNDYFNIFNSGRNILSSRHSIENILNLIDINILTNIIRKNNLVTFNIQQLSEEDIYTILKPYKEGFDFLLHNDNELCYLKDGKIYNQYSKDAELVIKSKIRKRYSDSYSIDDEDILQQPHVKNIFNDYFIPIELVTEKDEIEYNAKLEIYKEELQSWERKMIEIKKLQDLYDSEKYPDIPKPDEPEFPKKKLCYKLNYKGILLKKFFEKIEKEESNNFVENARIELAPYLDKEVSIFGTLVSEKNNAYLFKSIYVDGKIIDHLWVYDFNKNLKIGKTYELNGMVHIYTKEVNRKFLKNYGIKIYNAKEIG